MRKFPTSPPPSDFPSDVLKSIKKNAKPKMAVKLMQICKYFQHQKFPYFIIRTLEWNENFGWRYQAMIKSVGVWPNFQTLDLDTLDQKLWIIKALNITHTEDTSLINSLIPKLAVCDIYELTLDNQDIKHEHFQILANAGNITYLALKDTFIKDKNGSNVPLEDIFTVVPNVERLNM
uniref:Uncharacterized protein n=1 Tax=Panagrolaimus davidi TaxID=227884 RepID=A0A914PA15_9BILA